MFGDGVGAFLWLSIKIRLVITLQLLVAYFLVLKFHKHMELTKAGASTACSGAREGTHWDSHKGVEATSFSSSSALRLFKFLQSSSAKVQVIPCQLDSAEVTASSPVLALLWRSGEPRQTTVRLQGCGELAACEIHSPREQSSWGHRGPGSEWAGKPAGLSHRFHFVGISIKLSSRLCQFNKVICWISVIP